MLIELDQDPTGYIIWRLAGTHFINKDEDQRKVILISRILKVCNNLLRGGRP